MSIPFIQPDVKESVKELQRDLAYFFPELTHFYGYANGPDHNSKRCLDAMVYDSSKKYVAQQGRNNLGYNDRIELGNRVLVFLRENAKHYGLNGVVWNRKVYGFPHSDAPFGRNHYRGPYNVARNYTISAHDDHLHIDQDGSAFKPLRDTNATSPIGTVWVDVLKPGVTNSISIRLVQRALGVEQTGTYDDATIEAAKAYQKSLGDDVDGWLGPKQVTRLFADKQLSVTVRLDASGQAPKPPADQKPAAPEPEPKPEPAPVSHTFTATYANILRRTDTLAGRKRWPDRKANVVKHLNSTKPDLVLCVEVDSTTAKDIYNGLDGEWSYDRYEGVCVFWKQTEFERVGDPAYHEYSDGENRRLQSVPLKHKASGEQVWADVTHFENDGDTGSDGHKSRKVEATEMAARTKSGKRVFGADFNSTTRGGAGKTTREREKPRPILAAAGWKFLTDATGVTGRTYASHHGGKSSTPKGAWIDDLGYRGLDLVSGALVRTDGTDASDHHFLTATFKI